MRLKLNYEEVKYTEIKKYKSFYDKYDDISITNIKIKFGDVDELNPGRWVLKFHLFENGVDITNKITNQACCSPIRLQFINKKNNIIYFPFEDHFIFYDIFLKTITKINYNSNGRIYEVNNHIIVINNNGYLKINLDNLKYKNHSKNNLNFVYPLNNYDIIIYNDFLNYKKSTSFFSKNLQIKVSNLYDTSFNKFINQSFKDSQKGYLWSCGIKVRNNEIFHLPINKWGFIKYDIENQSVFIGTQLITNKGVFDETKRTMSFNAENKYLKISLNETFCSENQIT